MIALQPLVWLLLMMQPASPPDKQNARHFQRELVVIAPFDVAEKHHLPRQDLEFDDPTNYLAAGFVPCGWIVTGMGSKAALRPPISIEQQPVLARVQKKLAALKDTHDRPEDELIVIYVGHIVEVTSRQGKQRDVFLVMQDTVLQDVHVLEDVTPDKRLLKLSDLYTALARIPAERKMLILRAPCSFLEPPNYSPPLCKRMPKVPSPPSGVTVYLACKEGEYSGSVAFDFNRLRQWIEQPKMLSNTDDWAVVTLEDLLLKHQSETLRVSKTFGPKAEPQHPQILGKIPKDWVIRRNVFRDIVVPKDLLAAPFDAETARQKQLEAAKARKLDGPFQTNKIGMELAIIPPGKFSMGGEWGAGESPPMEVALLKPFWIGRHEVTQGQYEDVMKDNPSRFQKAEGVDAKRLPVEQVFFNNAIVFCNALSEREGLPPYYSISGISYVRGTKQIETMSLLVRGGPGYRLPTEAEWEYACRAGTTSAYWFGDAADGTKANVDAGRPGDVAPGRYLGRTSPVGSYAPNPFGLFDTHGNVWEYCQDAYNGGRFASKEVKLRFGESDGHRGGAIRGGSWNFDPEAARSQARLGFGGAGAGGASFVGFRVARSLE